MNDRNMAVLEQELSVTTALRGQELKITGDPENIALAEQVIEQLLALTGYHSILKCYFKPIFF